MIYNYHLYHPSQIPSISDLLGLSHDKKKKCLKSKIFTLSTHRMRDGFQKLHL